MKVKNRFVIVAPLLFFLSCIYVFCNVLVSPGKRTEKESYKIELLHSDRIYKKIESSDLLVLIGNVRMKQGDMYLFCDSAYYYELSNSFEAFGEVRMKQSDTLSLRSKYMYYDGTSQLMKARQNVILTHRKVNLYTDSLNYDKLYEIGYFFEGGKLVDSGNVLVSDWGQYSLASKDASFYYNVKLDNPKFELTSDTLHYNTNTRIAKVVGPSNIINGKNHIYTELGYYNTVTGNVELFNRSVLVDPQKTLVGDSLFYVKENALYHAYGNVSYVDKQNKSVLLSDYCEYSDSTGYAMATKNTLYKDFSNVSDTLFVHADTIKLYTQNIRTDSVYRCMHAFYHVRSYRSDVQSVSDSLVYNTKERCLTLYKDPIVWHGVQQILGEEIYAFFNDSTIDSIRVDRQSLLAEIVDSVHFNQVASKTFRSIMRHGQIVENRADGNVYVAYYVFDKDSLMLGLNYTETTHVRIQYKDRKMTRIWTPAATGVFYPLLLIPEEKRFLESFAWFDYIRPLDKYDLFEWRGKRRGEELKYSSRKQSPLQSF